MRTAREPIKYLTKRKYASLECNPAWVQAKYKNLIKLE